MGCKYKEKKLNLSAVLNWFFSLIRDAIFGFLLLSGFLWLLGVCCPSFYNGVTQWANSPKLPYIIKCEVLEKLKKPSTNLEAYAIKATVEEKKDGIYDVIVASPDADTSIYEKGTSNEIFEDDRDFLFKRFVSKEGRRKFEFEYDVSVNHRNQGTEQLKVGSLSVDECPFEMFPIRRRK